VSGEGGVTVILGCIIAATLLWFFAFDVEDP
jgi:hypothetical protein